VLNQQNHIIPSCIMALKSLTDQWHNPDKLMWVAVETPTESTALDLRLYEWPNTLTDLVTHLIKQHPTPDPTQQQLMRILTQQPEARLGHICIGRTQQHTLYLTLYWEDFTLLQRL